MVNIENIYAKYGVNRISRIKNPIIIDLKSLELPYNSTLHYYTIEDLELHVNSKLNLLNKNNAIIVRTVGEYIGNTIGNFRLDKSKVREFIKEQTKIERKFKILKETEKKVTLTRNDLLVYNYGGLNTFYKYSSNPLIPYYKITNSLNTLIENINKDSSLNRNFFVNFEVTIPKYSILEMLLEKKISTSLLKRMSSYNYIIFIELWKFFNIDTRKDSVFDKLTIDSTKKLYLIFSIGDNGSIINFNTLASMVKEYTEFDYSIKTLPIEQFRKVLYLYLNKIYKSLAPIESNLIEMEDNDEDFDNEDIDTELDIEESNNVVDEEDLGISLDETSRADIDDINIDSNYSSVNDIKNEVVDVEEKLLGKINGLKELGVLSVNRTKTLSAKLLDQDNMTIEVGDKKYTIKDIKQEVDTVIPKEETLITNTVLATENGMLNNTLNALDKKVITEQLTPYIIKSMLSVQNTSFIVSDINVSTENSILGSETTYEMNVENIDGGKNKIKIKLPTIQDDGTFKLSGNTYIMRRQKSDKPIRKISDSRVSLSSNYGKLFIDKAHVKRIEISYWLKNRLAKLYNDDMVKNLVLNNGKLIDSLTLPQHYTYFSKYVKSFKYQDYNFNFSYNTRDKITSMDLSILEQHGVIIGTYKNEPIVMTDDDRLLKYSKNKFMEISDLFSILNIDLGDAPVMYSTVKIYKHNIPIIILLSYYVGLSNLLTTYKVEHRILAKNDSYDSINYYSIPFMDKKLIIKRDFGKNDLLFGGLTSLTKYTKNIHMETFEKRDSYSSVFNMLELSITHINEIKHLEDLFIDPMTKDVLKAMDEPTNFKGLLVRAIELLTVDYYKHPNDISGVHIKSYDRIAGMVYKEIINGMKDQKNKSVFSKSKLIVNPYSVLSKINEDSATVLMDDINPIAALKQTEDVTSLGQGGRSKDSMAKDTRVLHESEIGVISEGGKDSGDVGITAYTSANPKLSSTLGMNDKLDFEKDGWTSVLSTSAMLAPFGISDDVKRLVFANIQNSHVIATNNMSIPYVRTGYESIIGSRVNKKFVAVAIDNGVVRDVTNKKVTVEYTDKDNKKYTEEYKLYDWYSKEENGSSFKHTVVSNVTKGTKVFKDYVLTYDKSFFTPDTYDRSRVVYRQGNTVRVAFIENIESYEDSAAISKDLGVLMTTDSIKSKSILIDKQQTIDSVVKIGDKVEHSTPLFIISDKDFDTKGLDSKTLEIIQNIKSAAPKAGIRGIVEDIKIFYNVDKEELSENLQYHVNKSDKKLKETVGFTGKVNSSYSIKGKPLMDGEIEIKVLIRVEDDMGIADKAILGNQLKCTIGDILEDVKDEEGKPVDVVFSTKSMSNRIVLSPVKIGLLTTYMKAVIDQGCDLYFS